MIMEAVIDEEVKGTSSKFKSGGEYGLGLKAKLGMASSTIAQKTTDIYTASKAAKKVIDDLKKKNKLNPIWNPEQVVEDALRQRFASKSNGKDLLCKLNGLVNFEYVTALEPMIGTLPTGKGTNVYGKVLQRLAADELCS